MACMLSECIRGCTQMETESCWIPFWLDIYFNILYFRNRNQCLEVWEGNSSSWLPHQLDESCRLKSDTTSRCISY
jgi:hypothetical protein